MTSKKKLRRRIAVLEAERVLCRPMTFSTLTIDFDERTIDYRGRVIRTAARCISIPIVDTADPVL